MQNCIQYVALCSFGVCAGQCGVGQAPLPDSAASFAPLLQWKSAVLSGDRVGLKALYSTAPPAKVTVPPAESSPEADVDFWAGLKVRSVDLDISQSTSPKPGIQVVQFQAEIQSGAPPKNETLYVSEGQVWQQQGSEWRLVVVQRTSAAHLMQPANKDKNIYPSDANARAEIQRAEQSAAKEHKPRLPV